MLITGRQFGKGENIPGVLVNGYNIPIDLFLTSRGAGDAAEYVASNSVEFGGECRFRVIVSPPFWFIVSPLFRSKLSPLLG